MRGFCYVVLFFSAVIYAQSQESGNQNFNSIYGHALRGEMKEVFSLLDEFDEERLTPTQLERKEAYNQRFRFRNEAFDYPTNQKDMVDLYQRFANYWHSILIEEVTQNLADSLFRLEMAYFLKERDELTIDIDSIQSNMVAFFDRFLEGRAYYGLVFGKTGHLHDLYVWGKESEEVYDISLPETDVEVPVVFMENFVSNGWAHYTTFGYAYSGGWVGAEKIYCVKDAYDIESENFLVSYVAHESQHFVDLAKYPNLKQVDLEYRAKLCELSLAETSLYSLIRKFEGFKKDDVENAHAYANYMIITQLTSKFFSGKGEVNSGNWEEVSSTDINKYARKLLKENSKELKKAGTGVETILLK